jgi:hypothetical protein
MIPIDRTVLVTCDQQNLGQDKFWWHSQLEYNSRSRPSWRGYFEGCPLSAPKIETTGNLIPGIGAEMFHGVHSLHVEEMKSKWRDVELYKCTVLAISSLRHDEIHKVPWREHCELLGTREELRWETSPEQNFYIHYESKQLYYQFGSTPSNSL